MLRQIRFIAKFTIIESLRNRLLWLSLLVVVIGFVLVEFIGDFAITEHRVTQVTILAAFLRMAAVIGVTLFVVASTMRELHDKTLEMVLAMPLPRSSYYFGKLLGFIQVALITGCVYSLLLLLYAEPEQVLIWGISLVLELSLVVALGLLMMFSFQQIPSALAGVFVIYIAARSTASILLMANSPIAPHNTLGQKFIDGFVEALNWVLPNLQAFARSEWLAYNTASWAELLPLLLQTLVFLGLLISVSLFDFYRKNF